MNFLISRSGERYGPYSQDQIREGLEEGWLALEDLVWHEELPEWRRLDQVFEVQRFADGGVDAQGFPKASPIAPFAAEPASNLPARTQVLKKKTAPLRTRPSSPEEVGLGSAEPGLPNRKPRSTKWLVPLSVIAGAGVVLGCGVVLWPGLKGEIARVLSHSR